MEQQTIEKLARMHIKGMSQTYQEDLHTGQLTQYTLAEYLAKLTDEEWEYRQNRKMTNLKRSANLREPAHPLNIDYTIERQLDKGVIQRLLTLTFLQQGENIIITGLTGTGKSYIAQAIGTKACEMLHRTMYYSMSTLTDTAASNKIQGNYIRWIKKVQQVPLLIIDDFGLTTIDHITRKALMDIVDYRYAKRSTIIVSQIPIKNWHSLIGEETIADAIMDRIIHNSHRIELKGESMRRKKKIAG